MRIDLTGYFRLKFGIAVLAGLCLAGCSRETVADPKTQIGAHPDLPALEQYLLPPMHVASVVGWKQGEKPRVLHSSPACNIRAPSTCFPMATS